MLTINRSLPAASRSYGRTRTADEVKFIVIHYTGNSSDLARSNANFFSPAGSNTRSAGAHYFVDKTSIYASVPELRVAWSVGDSGTATAGGRKFKGICTNSNSISIEMCSNSSMIHEDTIRNTIDLIVDLMKRYNVPEDHVIRHFDVSGKLCPGWVGWYGVSASAWDIFKAQLHGALHPVASTPVKAATTTEGGFDMSSFPTIKAGMRGEAVRTAQMLLNGRGYDCGTADGIAGKKFTAAAKKFQEANGLYADGILGQKSLPVLFGL